MNTVFAAEANDALAKATPREKRLMEQNGKKLYIGHEQREGWSGALPFYLFFCKDCGRYAKDYPHGYLDLRYLLCSHCRAHHDFVPWWAEFALLWQRVFAR